MKSALNSQRSGRFIVLEGADGTGKSAQSIALVKHLRARDIDVVATREPGGTPFAEEIRQAFRYSETTRTPVSDMLLLFAARQDNCVKIIRPALAAGQWVVAERFTYSTLAFQCAALGVDPQWALSIAQHIHADLWPDWVVLFDQPVAVTRQRLGLKGHLDRIEKESTEFMERVRTAYLEMSPANKDKPNSLYHSLMKLSGHKKTQWNTVNSDRPMAEITADLLQLANRWISECQPTKQNSQPNHRA